MARSKALKGRGKPKADLDMKAFRAAQVVRKRMRTKRKEIARAGFLTEPSRQLDLLRKAGIVAAHNPDQKAWRALIPPETKLPPGRPNLWFTLAPELGYLIGVDIAHQEVSVSITRADFGKLLDHVRRVPVDGLDGNPEHALDAAAELIRDVFGQVSRSEGATAEQVIGIGMGLPGPVNRESKTISPEMHILSAWSNRKPTFELSERLQDILPEVPIEVDNDASLGALGVHSWKTLTSNPDTVPRDLLYVRVGDGIGAGVVIKGKLVGGGSGFAGEIGHVKIDDRGSFCPRCGQRGCVETKTSERAVLAELTTAVFAEAQEKVTIATVIASDHPACFRSLHEAGWHLGAALAHARTLLDPTRIYIGGRMAHSDRFMRAIREGIVSNSLDLAMEVEALVVPSPRGLPKRRPDLGSAELLGAIAIALHRCGDGYIEGRLRHYMDREITKSDESGELVSATGAAK
ncbi:MAG TPA: ROK family protein [Solirubrobacterales bacterium]|nr:ROK family protein [Solirubrobacterales bacterium]